MIPLKAIFVISVLISGLIFSPSYSFAQSTTDDSPFSSFFEILRQIFSFNEDQSEPIIEFGDEIVIQTSGTSSTTDTTEKNILPSANAGPNQEVLEFETVTLDGSSSTDVDGTVVSYQWKQFSGITVTLSSLSDVNPTFTAPDVDSENILKFSLTVKDNSGGSSDDDVIITVNEIDGSNDDGSNDDGSNDDGSNDDGSNDDGSNDDGSNDDGSNNTRSDNNSSNDHETKVTVCHIPPGNTNNYHTIRVGESAVDAHLAHGDSLGECDENNFKNKNENKKENSGKGNSDVDNSEKDNQNQSNDKQEKKSNSEKGNKDKDDEDKNKKENSGKGNSNVDNSEKGNKDRNKAENEHKSRSENEARDNDDQEEDDDEDDDEDD